MKTQNKSHLTAISRKTLSLPAKYLLDNHKLSGKLLDYGCGRGDDAKALFADKYDLHYFPQKPSCEYDIIMCNYVLNVMSLYEVSEVIDDIKSYLKPNGIAYLAVRRDIKKEGVTSKGTEQWNVVLDLPVLVEKKNKFCIYELTK